MARRIFAYGTLEVPEVMEALLGRRLPAAPATLDGYARFMVRGCAYPGIVARAGASTTGLLYQGLDDDMLALIDRFESDLYERRTVRVAMAGNRRLDAEAYVVADEHRAALSDEQWSRERFVASSASAYIEQCSRLRRRWSSTPHPPGNAR